MYSSALLSMGILLLLLSVPTARLPTPRAVEIGAVEIIRGEPGESYFHCCVRPYRPVHPEAYRVHGLSDGAGPQFGAEQSLAPVQQYYYTTLHYTAPHYPALHYTTLHYTPHITLLHTLLHCYTSHSRTGAMLSRLHCNARHQHWGGDWDLGRFFIHALTGECQEAYYVHGPSDGTAVQFIIYVGFSPSKLHMED
jgi:hypothetical protein